MTTLVDDQIRDLQFEVNEGKTLTLRLAAFERFPSAKIHVKIQKDASFDGSFADFSLDSGKFILEVELLGEGANAHWHYAGVGRGESDKSVNASATHFAPNTSAEIVQYGIASDKSHMAFVGTSHIRVGMHGAHTSQQEKIIVFDKGAIGKCSPILRIDENDVTASHSAIVGKLSDEHLFYMLSRGIDLDSAKRLLTLGYLKPVLAFYEGELSARIQEKIEGGF